MFVNKIYTFQSITFQVQKHISNTIFSQVIFVKFELTLSKLFTTLTKLL